MQKLTNKKQWDSFWSDRGIKKVDKNYLFFDVLRKFLVPSTKKAVLEIGCIPGSFLIAFRKNFGYRLYGLDYSTQTEKLYENFKFNSGGKITFYNKDFFKFHPKKKWDVVCSFGFIEHFKKPSDVFNRHVNLLKEGGTLVIGLPNFRYAQYFLHNFFDKDNLKIHNLEVMDLKLLSEMAEKNGLKIDYLGYYRTAGFWTEKKQGNVFSRALVFCLIASFTLLSKVLNIPNRFLSPYILLVARKK